MANIHSLPKDMLIQLITTIQSDSLNLKSYLEYKSKMGKEIFDPLKQCPHMFKYGPNQYISCRLVGCEIHKPRNDMSLNEIKILFENYPHYFYYVIELISFTAKFHNVEGCMKNDCEGCLDSDIYIERLQCLTEQLWVCLPIRDPKKL